MAVVTGRESDGGGSRGWWRWHKVTRTSRSLKSVVNGGRSPRAAPPPSRRCGLGVRTEGNPPAKEKCQGSGEGERSVRTMVVSRARLEPNRMYIIRVLFRKIVFLDVPSERSHAFCSHHTRICVMLFSRIFAKDFSSYF